MVGATRRGQLLAHLVLVIGVLVVIARRQQGPR